MSRLFRHPLEGQISEKGILSIKRPRGTSINFIPQYCPYTINSYCRDSCPLFAEPSYKDLALTLCSVTLYFSTFEDLRK